MNDLFDDLRVGEPGRHEEHGEHADARKARDGVDLVDVDVACGLVHQEVHAGEAAAAAGFVGGFCALADLVCLRFSDVCGDEGLALGIVVFGVVVVEDRVRDDLADGGGG